MSSGTPSRYSASGPASGSQVHEDERTPRVDRRREQREVLVAQRAEALAVRDLAQLAAQVPGPAVEPAPQLREPGSRSLAEGVAAVTTHVLERPQLTVVASHHEHREHPDPVLEVVPRRRDVVERARELPDAGPEALLFEPGPSGDVYARRRNLHRGLQVDAHRQIMPDGRSVVVENRSGAGRDRIDDGTDRSRERDAGTPPSARETIPPSPGRRRRPSSIRPGWPGSPTTCRSRPMPWPATARPRSEPPRPSSTVSTSGTVNRDERRLTGRRGLATTERRADGPPHRGVRTSAHRSPDRSFMRTETRPELRRRTVAPSGCGQLHGEGLVRLGHEVTVDAGIEIATAVAPGANVDGPGAGREVGSRRRPFRVRWRSGPARCSASGRFRRARR